jgi:hypothetical protein
MGEDLSFLIGKYDKDTKISLKQFIAPFCGKYGCLEF